MNNVPENVEKLQKEKVPISPQTLEVLKILEISLVKKTGFVATPCFVPKCWVMLCVVVHMSEII